MAIDAPAEPASLAENPVLAMPYEHRAMMSPAPEDFIHNSFRSQDVAQGVRCVWAVAVFGSGIPEPFAYYFDRREFDVNAAQQWLMARQIAWQKFDTAKDSAYPKMTSAPRFVAFEAACELRAEAGGKLPSIEILAYNGGLLTVGGFDHPVVVDLAGLITDPDQTPIVKDHQISEVVGHGQAIKALSSLRISGQVSGTGKAAREVLKNHENGFKWRASIGCRIDSAKFVPPGKTIEANGRSFAGPLIYATKARLKEVSVLSSGADDDSAVSIAAAAFPGE